MSELFTILSILWRVLVPQVVVEYVSLYLDDDNRLIPLAPADDWGPWDEAEPDAVVQMRSFSWLGVAWWPRPVGEHMSWAEYQRLKEEGAA